MGGGCPERCGPPIADGGAAQAILPPGRLAGVLHDQAGQPQIAGDVLYPGGEGAMLPGVAIATRRAASLASMHPAARTAPDGGGSAGCAALLRGRFLPPEKAGCVRPSSRHPSEGWGPCLSDHKLPFDGGFRRQLLAAPEIQAWVMRDVEEVPTLRRNCDDAVIDLYAVIHSWRLPWR